MTSDQTFEEFAEKLFNKYLELNPQHGSSLGLHEYDGKVGDISEKVLKEEIGIYKKLLDELNSINRNDLSDINKYDYDVAKWGLESELFDLDVIKAYKRNPMVYAFSFGGIEYYISREYAPFDERLSSINKFWIASLKHLPTHRKILKSLCLKYYAVMLKTFLSTMKTFSKINFLLSLKKKAKIKS